MLVNMFTVSYVFFFFNDTATTEIYTLSLHDALPISVGPLDERGVPPLALRLPAARCARAGDRESASRRHFPAAWLHRGDHRDRKSTRLNSSHTVISYAVFCLKKKKTSATQMR